MVYNGLYGLYHNFIHIYIYIYSDTPTSRRVALTSWTSKNASRWQIASNFHGFSWSLASLSERPSTTFIPKYLVAYAKTIQNISKYVLKSPNISQPYPEISQKKVSYPKIYTLQRPGLLRPDFNPVIAANSFFIESLGRFGLRSSPGPGFPVWAGDIRGTSIDFEKHSILLEYKFLNAVAHCGTQR